MDNWCFVKKKIKMGKKKTLRFFPLTQTSPYKKTAYEALLSWKYIKVFFISRTTRANLLPFPAPIKRRRRRQPIRRAAEDHMLPLNSPGLSAITALIMGFTQTSKCLQSTSHWSLLLFEFCVRDEANMPPHRWHTEQRNPEGRWDTTGVGGVKGNSLG